jgi:N-acyl-D-aspartate/D-glutamate deacylase
MSSPASLLLINGRCIDIESGLDEVCAVAIKDGVISAIVKATDAEGTASITSESQSSASCSVVDCTGHVVCPGFIDLHSHGAGHIPTAELQAMDGCTFHGELEFGACDVPAWFAEREGDSSSSSSSSLFASTHVCPQLTHD